MRQPRCFQFSLRFILATITLCAVFLALVRMSDLASATAFVVFVGWMLLPVIATFASLYLELQGMSWRKRRRARSEPQGANRGVPPDDPFRQGSLPRSSSGRCPSG